MDEQSVDGGTGASPADLTGTLLAEKYRVVRPLGRGSTGTVYLCWHAALEKHVALKVLHPELSGNPGIVTRFQREAQATARLDHAHSVRVTDFGQDTAGDYLYLAMEYVEGRDLGQVLAEDWPLSDERIVHIMSQVLSALAAAHALGIVHRDLKPENILVRAPGEGSEDAASDDVKVCDFGIAQLSPIRLSGPSVGGGGRVHAVTAQGRVVGTPAYMSPEQARAEAQDARSDIYSAGIVLFQMLTRTTPFVAETPLSVAVMHCMTPPPPPSGYGPVHPGLEAACLKALSKTPEARFQTAREMQLALEASIAKRPSHGSARRISTPAPARRGFASAATRTQTRASDARTPSLTPAEVVVPDSIPKRPLSLLKGAAAAVVILAIIALPSMLARKPVKITRPVAAFASGAQASLPPAQPAPAVQPVAPKAPPTAAFHPPAPTARAPQPSAAAVAAVHRAPEPKVVALATPLKRAPRHAAVERGPLAETETHAASLVEASSSETREPAATPAAVAVETPAVAAAASAAASALASAASPVATPSEDLAPLPSRAVAPGALAATVTLTSQASKTSAAPVAEVEPVQALRIGPPPSAAPIAAHRFDPDHASVVVGTPVTHRAAVSKASVRNAINQGALTRCYRDALRSGGAPTQPVDARLDLSTGMGGRIVSASLDGAGLSRSLRECVEQVARAGRLREADTGEAQATVMLTFEPM